MSSFAYIRVSTRDQNEDRQLLAIQELSIPEKNIYIDHQSGKDFQRPAYQQMVKRMKKDDLLFIKSIDRLGRNYEESSVTLFFKCCHSWQRTSVPTSSSGKPRASPQPDCEG